MHALVFWWSLRRVLNDSYFSGRKKFIAILAQISTLYKIANRRLLIYK